MKSVNSIYIGTYEPDDKVKTKEPTVLRVVFQPYDVANRWNTLVHLHWKHFHFDSTFLTEFEQGMMDWVSSSIYLFEINAEFDGLTIESKSQI